MKKSALIAALFAVACLSLGAQVGVKTKKQQTKTDTIYVIEGISGIGG